MIPTGIAFDTSGQLGGDLLICENQTGNVKRIAAIGLVTTIATINIASNGLTDLLMGPSVGAGYGFDIYVSHSAESGGDPGRVFRMTTAGSMSTLTVSNATTPTGITFASGGTFGAATLLMLDAANYTQLDGKVWTIAPGGTTNNLTPAGSTPLFDPVSLSQALEALWQFGLHQRLCHRQHLPDGRYRQRHTVWDRVLLRRIPRLQRRHAVFTIRRRDVCRKPLCCISRHARHTTAGTMLRRLRWQRIIEYL